MLFNLNLNAQEPILRIETPEKEMVVISHVAISPDGKTILTGGFTPILWDAETGEKIKTFPSGIDVSEKIRPECIVFSKDGKYVLIGWPLFKAQLWNVESGKLIHTFYSYTLTERVSTRNIGGISAAAFSKDGKKLLTGDVNGAIQLWDFERKEEIRRYINVSTPRYLEFINDNKQFVVKEAGIIVFNTLSGEVNKAIICGFSTLSLDNKYLLTSSYTPDDSDIKYDVVLWDTSTLSPIKQYLFKRIFNTFTFTPNGEFLIVGAGDNMDGELFPRIIIDPLTKSTIKTYSVKPTSELKSPYYSDSLIRMFPSGKKFLTVNGTNVHVWDIHDIYSAIDASMEH